MSTPSARANVTLDAARLFDLATLVLLFECEACSGQLDETTVETVLQGAAANLPGVAIAPELEAAMRAARMRDDARALLRYHVTTCPGEFDEATVQAVLKRAEAAIGGDAITPQLRGALR